MKENEQIYLVRRVRVDEAKCVAESKEAAIKLTEEWEEHRYIDPDKSCTEVLTEEEWKMERKLGLLYPSYRKLEKLYNKTKKQINEWIN